MTTGQTTDLLLESALQGEERAFESLYDRFSNRLERYVRDRIGGRVAARVDPEDIVQEVFAEVFTHITKYQPRGKGSFHRLLVTIARRRVIDVDRRLATRREKKFPAAATQEKLTFEDDIPARGTGPLTALLRSEERDLCREAFEDLPDGLKEIITLRLVEERSVPEISQLTGKSPGAVWVWFHRALHAWSHRFTRLRDRK